MGPLTFEYSKDVDVNPVMHHILIKKENGEALTLFTSPELELTKFNVKSAMRMLKYFDVIDEEDYFLGNQKLDSFTSEE
ncbi:MAG: hypothetical protein AB7U85_02620 [Alphaproteobacteria bacterium]